MRDEERARTYWRKNLMLVGILLTIWFLVSLGCGVLFVDALDKVRVGGFKLGFWFAQQGSIYTFVLLIVVYVVLMNRLDRQFQRDNEQALDASRTVSTMPPRRQTRDSTDERTRE